MSLFYSGRSIFYDEVIPPAVMMRIQKQYTMSDDHTYTEP